LLNSTGFRGILSGGGLALGAAVPSSNSQPIPFECRGVALTESTAVNTLKTDLE